MWIESHQSLLRHRKTNQAVRLLGCDRFKLIGHLHALWWWALDNAPSGQALADYEIVDGAEWDGNPKHFVESLSAAGFIESLPDGDYLIHDWHTYAGKLIDRRKEAVKRTQEWRRKQQAEAVGDVTHNVPITYAHVIADRTVPNRTVPNQGTGADAPPAPKKPKKTREPKPTQPLVEAFCQARNVEPGKLPDKVKKDLAARAEAIADQYPPEDVAGCVAYLLTDRWHYDKALPALFTMTISALPTWVADGRPAKQNGRINGYRDESRAKGWDLDGHEMVAGWLAKKGRADG